MSKIFDDLLTAVLCAGGTGTGLMTWKFSLENDGLGFLVFGVLTLGFSFLLLYHIMYLFHQKREEDENAGT